MMVSILYSGEVVLDDRSNTRLGNRLTEAELVGYPFVVVVGRDAASGKVTLGLHGESTANSNRLRFFALCQSFFLFFMKVELHRRQHGSSDVIGINQLCEAVLSS